MKRPTTGKEPVSPSGETTPQQRKDRKRALSENARSATSEKLDWLDAVCMDPRLRASDFKVAFKLMQFRNAESGLCYPSYATLGDETSLKPETVRTCIKKLSQCGWIDVRRPNYSKPNVYQFNHDHVNVMLDRRVMLREARAELRMEQMERTALQSFDRDLDNGGSSRDRDEDNGPVSERRHGEHVSDHPIINAGNNWTH